MEHIRILLLGVSFRVYISYKIRTRQKSGKDWKSGNGRNAWSPQRVHFSDWFFQKFVLDNANSQMYQSHKTLRLRREMSLPLTFIQPFQDNPQSCPFFLHGDSIYVISKYWWSNFFPVKKTTTTTGNVSPFFPKRPPLQCLMQWLGGLWGKDQGVADGRTRLTVPW